MLHSKELDAEKLDYLAAKTKDLEQMNKHSEKVIAALSSQVADLGLTKARIKAL